MNNLHQAYIDLGIPVGSSLEAIESRYKRLVMAWHPDRYPNEEHKREAEEELKKINNAKDLLKDHFKGSQHKETGACDCRAGVGSSEQAQSARQPGSSGPARKAKTTAESKREESEAQFRDDERSKRAAEEERQQAEQAAKQAHEETIKTAFSQESQRNTEPLRWKICIGSAAVSILLMFVPGLAYLVEQPILAGQNVIYGQHGESEQGRKLSEDWRNYQNDKAQVASTLIPQLSGSSDTTSWRPPFISKDRSADYFSNQAYQELVVKVEEKKKQHAMDVYKARSDVDRYQKAIERSQSVLVEAEAKLANPNTGLPQQRMAQMDQESHRRYLQENQDSLKAAQQHLDELEAEGPGAVPLEPRFGPAPASVGSQQVGK